MMTSGYPLQSIQGPTDPMLRSNAIEGYSQVSRIGESVINAFGKNANSSSNTS